MSIFALSFRVGRDADYDERYNSMVEKIKEVAGAGYWDETTSFFIFSSNSSSSQICSKVYVESKMNSSKDILVVIDLSKKEYDQKGAIYPNTLAGLMNSR